MAPEPDRRLLLDVMLGGLRSYLRMCGYDTAYALDENVESDEAIRRTARTQDRTLLTRDRQLAARCDDAVLLESRDVTDQLAELVAAGFELGLPEEPAICGRCNGSLRELDADESIPAYAPSDLDRAWRCRDCGQVFWKGSHWERVRETLARITG